MKRDDFVLLLQKATAGTSPAIHNATLRLILWHVVGATGKKGEDALREAVAIKTHAEKTRV